MYKDVWEAATLRLAAAIAADGRLADREPLGSGSPLIGLRYRRMDIFFMSTAFGTGEDTRQQFNFDESSFQLVRTTPVKLWQNAFARVRILVLNIRSKKFRCKIIFE